MTVYYENFLMIHSIIFVTPSESWKNKRQTVAESICLKCFVNNHNLSKKQNEKKSHFVFL